MFKRILIISMFFLLTMGMVSAADNDTVEATLDDAVLSQDIDEIPITENIDNVIDEIQSADDCQSQVDTKIETNDVTTYYKENAQLVSYLKGSDNQPVLNKSVSVSINGKVYNKTTDADGKFVLDLNLKPKTYVATINFAGDDDYASSIATSVVKVNKASLLVETKDYKTYWESDLFFKAKVINKITKNPVKGIKVAFKVYTNNKYKIYYATTDANGVAYLKKNFKVGSYKVVTYIKKDKNLKSKSSKATLTIKPTAETGCSSLYVQVSNTEAVAGFRRDATNAKTLHIVKYTLSGKSAIKQYKKNSYFFHLVTTADGWMFATGGRDNAQINHAIEKLAGKMAKSGKIVKSYLKKIQKYEKTLGIGHFSIKAPNGKYAIVWASGIKTGKLKPGEYICVPNGKSCFRHGTWAKFSKDPAKAAIKIAATDSFGVNRRDATAFHWKATTTEGKTTSTLKVYAANDNGRLMGRSTAHLKDDIYFKGKFFSKNKLPKTPSMMLLGVHKFGSIDKLIKTQTTVKAPKLTKTVNQAKTFDITVKNKKTKKPIKNLSLKIKIGKKVYTVKTNSKGVAKFNTKSLKAGTYSVAIYSGNIKYFVSAKSTIKIKSAPTPAKTNNTKTNTTEVNTTVNNTVETNVTETNADEVNITVNNTAETNSSAENNVSVNGSDYNDVLAIGMNDNAALIKCLDQINMLASTKS
ncbi:hypothetical protein [Methanobrevibacter sp.]|uniref:hypothetical protein n=1 Tax=Methanobrevibacter sp. TaxID=66852 RepID=UPI00386AD011